MLFTREEICRSCEKANWHLCDKCVAGPSFCHCSENIYPDFITGFCENHSEIEKDE